MFFSVKSCAFSGAGIEVVDVECDINVGMPVLAIVGLPDAAVKESRERVRAAITNSNLWFPYSKRIIINLSPAGSKKEGTQLDLAMALSILAMEGEVSQSEMAEIGVIGELSLEGRIQPASRALPLCLEMRRWGLKRIIVPKDSIKDVCFIEGVSFYPVSTLDEAYRFIKKEVVIEPVVGSSKYAKIKPIEHNVDYSEVRGRQEAKRGVEIGVSGFHNILMTGAPGSGKSMIAKRIATVLPEMSYEEMLEVTRIYSLGGRAPKEGNLISTRPFRAPAGNISLAAMIGGGNGFPRPGEISMAHYGALFLDEIPEFRRDVLEALRQPLEDEEITISRMGGSVTYPCKFMLIGARNPCPCGYFNDPVHKCTCTSLQIKRYSERLSGPIMDRFDLFLDLYSEPEDKADDYFDNESSSFSEGEANTDLNFEKLLKPKHKSSEQMRKQIAVAREMQNERYAKEEIIYNSQLKGRLLTKYCRLQKDARDLFLQGYRGLKLSPRAGDKVLKVARTIADMEEMDNIEVKHIAEALQYRRRDEYGI